MKAFHSQIPATFTAAQYYVIAFFVLAAISAAFSQAPPLDGRPVGGYIAAFGAIGAAALATPAVVLAVNRTGRRLLRRRVEGLLASRSLTASLSRTSVVVAALATAIAMMASVGIMVGSFRRTVAVWLDTQLRADLYVRPSARAFGNDDMEVDGILGARTRAAINEFQALFGLPETGEPDEAVYAKMREIGLTN